jgi:hypothetical protein
MSAEIPSGFFIDVVMLVELVFVGGIAGASTTRQHTHISLAATSLPAPPGEIGCGRARALVAACGAVD